MINFPPFSGAELFTTMCLYTAAAWMEQKVTLFQVKR